MEDIYDFLDEPTHRDVYEWVRSKDATDEIERRKIEIAATWRIKMNSKIERNIFERCHELFQVVDFDWNEGVT